MDIQKTFRVIGLMSGTSLDGLDICYAAFDAGNDGWNYRILQTQTVDYSETLRKQLANARHLSAYEYARLHSDYGLYLGQCVKDFMEEYEACPDFIASHGHTIFHEPSVRFTAQIGSGAGIAAVSGVDCICDFRTTDVASFGQGAPLVPVGDRLLFGLYDYCLNLGGFSNISFEDDSSPSRRVAYDISPANYVLNHYVRTIGRAYDAEGCLARRGKVCVSLLDALNDLPYYQQQMPKSLGWEWVVAHVYPLIDAYELPLQDILCTFCEHIAVQVSAAIKGGTVLLSGGGAHNTYLVERMQALAPQCRLHVPDSETINFKEALLFAFLGVLYVQNETNCLQSVTGARTNVVGGCLYKGLKKIQSL